MAFACSLSGRWLFPAAWPPSTLGKRILRSHVQWWLQRGARGSREDTSPTRIKCCGHGVESLHTGAVFGTTLSRGPACGRCARLSKFNQTMAAILCHATYNGHLLQMQVRQVSPSFDLQPTNQFLYATCLCNFTHHPAWPRSPGPPEGERGCRRSVAVEPAGCARGSVASVATLLSTTSVSGTFDVFGSSLAMEVPWWREKLGHPRYGARAAQRWWIFQRRVKLHA